MKAIIIGAGLGGLATACRLAKAGYSVEVYEKNPGPGGKASELKSQGFRFDSGPSVLTMPFILQELFHACSEKLEDYLSLIPLPLACRYFYSDKITIDAHHDLPAFQQEILSKTTIDKTQLQEYFHYLKEIYEFAAPIFLFSNFRSLKILSHPTAKKMLLKIGKLDAFRSMHQANSKFLKNSKLVQLFDRFATYNGSNPYETPATLNIIAHVEQVQGTYTVQKGIHQIPLALRALADKLGVRFHWQSPAIRIHTDNKKKVTGLELSSGQFIPSNIIISNLDIVPTYEILFNQSKNKIRKKYEKLGLSSSAVVFYWGIKGTHPQLDVNNIFFSEDYQKEFQEIFKNNVYPEDPTIYVHISSRINTEDAPTGRENWFVMINGPHEAGQNWQEVIPRLKKAILQKLRQHGLDLASSIVFEKVSTPSDLAEHTGSFKGSLYGISSNNRFAAFLRHPNKIKKVRGLYVVGGSVHPGGGMPLVLLSAQHAVNTLQKDFPNAESR